MAGSRQAACARCGTPVSGAHRCTGRPHTPRTPRTPRSVIAHAPTATAQPRGTTPATPIAIFPADIARAFASRYRIEDVLGRGGWATVYRARRLDDGTDVALKVLSPELRADASHVRRFLAEARTLAQVHHPHVVTVRDCGQAGSFVYLALELLAGRSLAEEIARRAPLLPSRAANLAAQICDGLGAAHDRGIIHRDLKPENILLLEHSGGGDFAKVADFGIARSLVDEADEGGWWLACTPRYASPEQARGDEADARSDVFAVGLVLFEMLGGVPAFPIEETLATLRRRSTTAAPELERACPGLALPPGLSEVVARLLALDPAHRPRSCAEARTLLVPYCEGSVTLRPTTGPLETADIPAVFAPLDLSPPLRGRGEELSELLALVDRLDDHPRASVAVVAGAPGSGKSRLCGEAADLAVSRHGARRFERECSGGGALADLAELIEDVLGTRGLDPAVLRRRLGDLLGDPQGALDLTAVLRPAPGSEARASDSEAERNYRCQLALDTLGRIAAQRPLVVFLEEAQRADALTRALIARLPVWSRDRGRGLLLLATWTTGTGVDPPQVLQRERFAERARLVQLRPLSREGADALLRAVGPLDAAARERIAELAGGNPLHLVQLVRHFRAERLLVPSRRGWRLSAQARFDTSVPAIVGDLHVAQVARLRAKSADGSAAADLLVRLALVGERTPIPLLRALLEREGRSDLLLRLDTWIALLVSEGLVAFEGDSLRFPHALAREAIAASAGGRPEVRDIHRAIAEALLASAAEDGASGARAAAWHLWQGGEAERALPMALRAAAASRALGDGPRASEGYLLALRIFESSGAPDPSLRLEVELGLGASLLLGGETRQAEDHFARALTIADGPVVREGLGRVAETKGDYVVARDHLLRAEELFAAEGRAREAAEVSVALGRTMHKLGDLDGARQRFERASGVLEGLGDSVGAARARMWLGGLGAWTGEFAAGLAVLERALPVLETTGNPLLIGECLNHMGSLAAEMGRYRDAVDLNRRAQSCFERAGMFRGVVNALGAIGTARGFLGEVDEAHQLLEASLRLAEDIEHDAQISYCLVNLGWLCRRAGRLEESTQWLRSALAHLQRRSESAELPFACVELGLTLLERGLLDEAEAEFRRALAVPSLRPDMREDCQRRLAAIDRARRAASSRRPPAKTPGRKRKDRRRPRTR